MMLDIGRKFRINSLLSEGFLRSKDRTADLRDRGKLPVSKERLTMLYKTGTRRST